MWVDSGAAGEGGNRMQEIVRTYPPGYLGGVSSLSKLLSQGYRVVMCHEINDKNGSTILEYIIEKEEVEE